MENIVQTIGNYTDNNLIISLLIGGSACLIWGIYKYTTYKTWSSQDGKNVKFDKDVHNNDGTTTITKFEDDVDSVVESDSDSDTSTIIGDNSQGSSVSQLTDPIDD